MPFGGETVRTSGVYRSAHYLHRDHDAEHALILGQPFPRCKQCPDVEYILMHAAPGLQEDADFKSKDKGLPKSSAA